MLKPLVPKFRPDLSILSKDITEKHPKAPAKLKPMVTLFQATYAVAYVDQVKDVGLLWTNLPPTLALKPI